MTHPLDMKLFSFFCALLAVASVAAKPVIKTTTAKVLADTNYEVFDRVDMCVFDRYLCPPVR